MSAKNKGAKSAKTKQRAEKAKPAAATKLIPELAAMKFPAKMVAKLEALGEADQDTVLNYVNSGMKINDAYQRTIAGKPEQQLAEPEAATPAPEVASPEAVSAGQAETQITPEATPGAETESAGETTEAPAPGTQPEAKKRSRAPKADTGPKKAERHAPSFGRIGRRCREPGHPQVPQIPAEPQHGPQDDLGLQDLLEGSQQACSDQ
jgi:hypothetical protein